MRYKVQFTGMQNGVPVSLALTVDAASPELAWDAYKHKTGLRRWIGDAAPVIQEAVGDGTDSGTDHEP